MCTRRRSDEGENGEVRREKSGEKREGTIAPEKYKCSREEEAGRWERKTESGFARYLIDTILSRRCCALSGRAISP